jgi:hypothetical protein
MPFALEIPRFAAKHEHTTEHQVHSIKWLREMRAVCAAMSEDELESAIARAMTGGYVADAEVTSFSPKHVSCAGA